MGTLNTVLITGASGFVGSAAVAHARSEGVQVIATYRRALPAGWALDEGITPLRVDLSDSASVTILQHALRNCDAVIHAAAHLGSNSEAVAADTVAGTRHLLEAMTKSKARLVLVSSISVYDMMRLNPCDTLDETCPVLRAGYARDAYSGGKLEQELLVTTSGRSAWLMRAGAVYGPGRTWHALMGFWASKLYVEIASDGELPMVHVDHLGDALLRAAGTDPNGVQAVNVIDDDTPTRVRFATAHRTAAGWPKLRFPVPYGLWMGVAKTLSPLSKALPGLLREDALRARMMPLRLSNKRLRTLLGGADHAPFETMLKRSVEQQT